MKFLFINIYPPSTLAKYLLSSYLLKAYLEEHLKNQKNQILFEVLDFSQETPVPVICDEIILSKPAWIGYSCYVWNIEKINQTIVEVKNRHECLHILGGPEISASRASSISESGVGDYFVIGEGENKLLNLVKYLTEENDNLEINFPKGIAYRKSDTFHYSEDDDVVDLSTIPSVYLNSVLEKKLYARQQAFLETQRGCKYRCKYCVYHKNLPTINYYPIRRIIRELDHLIIDGRVLAIRIFDAVFTSDLERSKNIIRHLLLLKKKKGARLPWIYWEFVYNSVDEEFIELTAALKYRKDICNTGNVTPLDRPQVYSDLLKDYTTVNCVGVQSFNSRALRAIGRVPVNLKSFDRFMSMAQHHNVVLKIDLILGLPFETLDSYFKGLAFFLPYFKDTDHILNIHRLKILPGSELEGLCEKYGIKYVQDSSHNVLSTSTMSYDDLLYASRLTAILFRILNSPLRRYLFEAKERMGIGFMEVVQYVLSGIESSKELKTTRFMREGLVDDDYWNDDIFREVPSEWLIHCFESL